jgi:hypothetical protein
MNNVLIVIFTRLQVLGVLDQIAVDVLRMALL